VRRSTIDRSSVRRRSTAAGPARASGCGNRSASRGSGRWGQRLGSRLRRATTKTRRSRRRTKKKTRRGGMRRVGSPCTVTRRTAVTSVSSVLTIRGRDRSVMLSTSAPGTAPR
jgi:hypothetical protein